MINYYTFQDKLYNFNLLIQFNNDNLYCTNKIDFAFLIKILNDNIHSSEFTDEYWCNLKTYKRKWFVFKKSL